MPEGQPRRIVVMGTPQAVQIGASMVREVMVRLLLAPLGPPPTPPVRLPLSIFLVAN